MVTEAMRRDLPAPQTPSIDVLRRVTPEAVRDQGYRNIPFLKRPLWRWEIAWYFACEGVSAGAYVISTMADLFGGGRYDRLVQAARYLSLIFILPAPPLLVADLGRPERFHHMLRVIKPISPMNVGSWALTTYSIPVALLAAQQAREDSLPFASRVPRFVRRLPTKTLAVAGMPAAMTMISYPGVLLSMTSTPVWTSSRLLGALISLSSISMGAAAISLVLGLSRDYGSLRAVGRIERIASVCEAGVLAGYVATSRTAARPLVAGRYAKQFWLGAVACGLLLPAIMHGREKERGSRGILRSLLTLAGGFALKWALVHVGRTSALDPNSNRYASRATESAPGWSPELSGARRTEERAA